MFKFLFVAVLVVALALGIGGYVSVADRSAPVTVELKELVRDPATYDGKAVTVSGIVSGRVSTFGAGGYRITGADDTAVLVVGLNTAPRPGERIVVTGVFHVAVAVGPYQLPLIVAR